MIVQIDENSLNDDLKALITTDEKGNKLNLSGIKTQADVDRVLNAKRHVDEQLTNLKSKYKGVDLQQYQNLLSNQLEQNKDVLANPVYKNLQNRFNSLTDEYNSLKSQIAKRDEALIDSELKDIIRNNKEIQQTAVDDIFYRLKNAGFAKTEKGFLNKEGKTVDAFMDDLKSSAKHLFKQTSTIKFNQENVNNALKNNDKKTLFDNLQVKN